jgi:hypothetical protein
MSLIREITLGKVEKEFDSTGPVTPDGWSIGSLANHGLILSCDGFQLQLGADQLQLFFDVAESGQPGEVHDQNGDLVLVEPTNDSIVLTRAGDKVYPSGLVLDLKTLKELGIEKGNKDPEEDADPLEIDDIVKTEGVERAYYKSGDKIKKGFRITSGYRKSRVVADIATAHKPKAKASTRRKLSIAGHKKKFIRLLKSRRTRKKSISKRLHKLNAK